MLEDRRLDDRWTWKVCFDETDVICPATPDSVLEHSTFKLRMRKFDAPDPGYYNIEARKFNSLVLKYNYTVAHDYFRSGFWLHIAGPRLEQLSLIDLCNIPSTSRPQEIQ